MRLAWYEDEYVRTADGWRIRSRSTTFMRRSGGFDSRQRARPGALRRRPRDRVGHRAHRHHGRARRPAATQRRSTRWSDDAAAADEAGFATAWIPQLPQDFDAMTAVALMGRADESHRARHRGRAAAVAPPDRARPTGAVGAGGVRRALPPRRRAVAPLDHRRHARAALRAAGARWSSRLPRRVRRDVRGPGPGRRRERPLPHPQPARRDRPRRCRCCSPRSVR